jgi:hypothetical protein
MHFCQEFRWKLAILIVANAQAKNFVTPPMLPSVIDRLSSVVSGAFRKTLVLKKPDVSHRDQEYDAKIHG